MGGPPQARRQTPVATPKLALQMATLVDAMFGRMFHDWGAADWQAFAYMIIAGAAVVTGFWALFNYFASRRSRASDSINGLFHDFYLDDRLRRLKVALEYGFSSDGGAEFGFLTQAGPLLEQRIWDRDVPLSSSAVRLLGDLDTLLNYFEMVLYLEQHHRIGRKDSLALFEYWFQLLRDPNHAPLRRYIAHFGFERVAKRIGADNIDRVMLYGSLKRYSGEQERLGISPWLHFEGECTAQGRLFSLGEYPGLLLDPLDGLAVPGELYRIEKKKEELVFGALDRFERFSPFRRETSLYQRRHTELYASPGRPHPGIATHAKRRTTTRRSERMQNRRRPVDAWTYVFNGDVTHARDITLTGWVDAPA